MIKEIFTAPYHYGKIIALMLGMMAILTPIVAGAICGIYWSIARMVEGKNG